MSELFGSPEFQKVFRRVEHSLFRNGIPNGPPEQRKNAQFLVIIRTLEFLKFQGKWDGDPLQEARRLIDEVQ